MFILRANKTQLILIRREPVTSGSVNVYTVGFEFSEDWDGMERTAVFRAGNVSRSVLLNSSNETVIPWEVLEIPRLHLFCGVHGTKDGDTVLPTIWADMGIICQGTASTEEEARPPTPDIWQQKLDAKADGLDYDGMNLSLMSGEKPLSTVQIEGIAYKFGHGLKQSGLEVSVDIAGGNTKDRTLPISAAAVDSTVGNIEILLKTI